MLSRRKVSDYDGEGMRSSLLYRYTTRQRLRRRESHNPYDPRVALSRCVSSQARNNLHKAKTLQLEHGERFSYFSMCMQHSQRAAAALAQWYPNAAARLLFCVAVQLQPVCLQVLHVHLSSCCTIYVF